MHSKKSIISKVEIQATRRKNCKSQYLSYGKNYYQKTRMNKYQKKKKERKNKVDQSI